MTLEFEFTREDYIAYCEVLNRRGSVGAAWERYYRNRSAFLLTTVLMTIGWTLWAWYKVGSVIDSGGRSGTLLLCAGAGIAFCWWYVAQMFSKNTVAARRRRYEQAADEPEMRASYGATRVTLTRAFLVR